MSTSDRYELAGRLCRLVQEQRLRRIGEAVPPERPDPLEGMPPEEKQNWLDMADASLTLLDAGQPLARVGLDRLLDHFQRHVVLAVETQRSFDSRDLGPWTIVDLAGSRPVNVGATERFAIWNRTGNVYRTNEHGAVEDDPFIEVTPLTVR